MKPTTGECLDKEQATGGDELRLFDAELAAHFRGAAQRAITRPGRLLFLARQLLWQRRAAKKRLRLRRDGLTVPAILIMSVTGRCNLTCAGCYRRTLPDAAGAAAEKELTASEWQCIVGEAADLGVSIVMIAGGEPLLRPEILDITARFPRVVFPLFSNGRCLTPDLVDRFAAQPQVIPILSVEGGKVLTDERRGPGVYEGVMQAFGLLSSRRLFFGASITVTAANFDLVTSPAFARTLTQAGCGILFYVEYVPTAPGTENLVLTPDQRRVLPLSLANLQKDLPAAFIAFPGDETPYGGCLAAGRGFLHVNPAGRLEPCPFAPFADVCLRERPLRQALQSKFLQEVRRRHHLLSESNGGCALWANRRILEEIAKG